MTLVDLHPPVNYSSGWRPWGEPAPIPLRRGPAYVRTRKMGRWHRVRSGAFHPAWDAQYGHRRAYTEFHLWCGQSVRASNVLAAHAPWRGEPACGTCEGRAVGADPSVPEVIHTARTVLPPRWCPGGEDRTQTLWTPHPDPRGWARVATCRVCGLVEPVRAKGGCYSGYVGITRHQTGPDLVPGCPFHAWRQLRVLNGVLECSCVNPGRWS